MSKIKCIDCECCHFQRCNGSPSRYYCLHPAVVAGIGSVMICRCQRGSDEITIKSSPTWCPKKVNSSNWRCKICGCTDELACVGGCYWVAPNLCSKCAEGIEINER